MSRPRYSRRAISIALLAGLIVFSAGFGFGRYGFLGGSRSASDNFWTVKNLIKERYVHGASDESLIVGATKGLVEGTGDPYSEFLTKEEAKQLSDALAGSVEGIGIELGEKDGQLTVIAPLPGTPAERAGIVAGDVIVSVDNQAVSSQSINDVAKMIRGPKGTSVKLEVRTPGAAESRTLNIVREMVQAPSVTLKYQGDVAIITLSRFGDDTKGAMDKAVADIQQHKPRGVVLDMRSNPGGYLDGAIEVTSIFLKEGAVVKEQFAHGKTDTKNVVHDGRLADLPLVVLVDRGSASAAEITAGALRDDRGIRLVGETTYGKGSVQELEELSGGAVLKLTIAEWLTPKGLSISKQGLKPDVAVASDNPAAQLQAAIANLK